MKYERQPNIQSNLNKKIINYKFCTSFNNDNDSIISEISGDDSESIRIYTPSNQCKIISHF